MTSRRRLKYYHVIREQWTSLELKGTTGWVLYFKCKEQTWKDNDKSHLLLRVAHVQLTVVLDLRH